MLFRSFIIQEHFPPAIDFTSSGPLFGVQFSNLTCTDVKKVDPANGNLALPLGLAGDPGGIPLYKGGEPVGAIGVEADGLYTIDFTPAVKTPSVDEIIAPGPAALYRIGTGNLRLQTKSPATPDEAARFGAALVTEQKREGLFAADPLKIAFLGERLFRTTIGFPANVPTGTYIVEVFLVRDRDVVSGQTTPLVVSKVGLDAAVSDFATRQSAAYGAIAVVTAVVAGWLASLPFRGV